MQSILHQVKGYINEMAVRLEDEDERISSLAKLFFLELSKKGFSL
jgi:condensin complex subunit 1